MQAAIIANLFDAVIPFCSGLYCTLLAYRLVGKQLGQDPRYDAWHNKYTKILKVLGPFLMLFALFIALQAIDNTN